MYDGDGVRTTTMTTLYEDGVPASTSWTAYFFGGAYEVRSDSTTIKYYSFGGQTIMNDGDGLKYLLNDHLGSVVAVTDDEGNLISQNRYLPFGGVRSDINDITQTDYGYTGQRNLDSDIGLMDYKFRFYSPVLGRFILPDSIIPDMANPQTLNRYSYVYNRPIIYADPTGHCPLCFVVVGATLAYMVGTYTAGHVFGLVPDYRGINYAEKHVTDGNTVVAAGLAVQSQWYQEWWDTPTNKDSSSWGPAQITQSECDNLGYGYCEGVDIHSSNLAVLTIEERIRIVLKQCPNCSERDKLILTALAQNGTTYALDALRNVSRYDRVDGQLDWVEYFDRLNEPKDKLANFRDVGHHNFSSRFQIHLFMNNLEELGRRGWKLPDLSSQDWKYINNLRWGWGSKSGVQAR